MNYGNDGGSGETNIATAHAIEDVKELRTLLVVGKVKESGVPITSTQWMSSQCKNRLNGILANEMGIGKAILCDCVRNKRVSAARTCQHVLQLPTL